MPNLNILFSLNKDAISLQLQFQCFKVLLVFISELGDLTDDVLLVQTLLGIMPQAEGDLAVIRYVNCYVLRLCSKYHSLCLGLFANEGSQVLGHELCRVGDDLLSFIELESRLALLLGLTLV